MEIHDIKKILNTLDKDVLIEIICEAADQDSEYGAALALKYGPKTTNLLALCEDRMRSSLKMFGYSDMYDAASAVNAFEEVAAQAKSIKEEEPLTAFKIFWQAASLLSEIYETAYDEDGEIDGCIEDCCDEIKDISASKQLSHHDSDEIVALVLDRLENISVDDYYGLGLVSSAMAAVRTTEQKVTMDAALAQKIKDDQSENGRDPFRVKDLARARFSLIQRFEGDDAAFKFAKSNIDVYGFRKIVADYTLEFKRLEQPAQSCLSRVKKG